jgi:cytochrome c2
MSVYPSFAGAVLLSISMTVPAAAQDAAAFYEDNCSACHTIGGGNQAGPDLDHVTARRPRAWLVRFLLDPPGVVASGDPVATALVSEWNGEVMEPTPGLTPALAEALLAFIEEGSSAGAQPQAPAEFIVTPDDVTHGRRLFTGSTALASGGAACAMCHAAGDIAAGTLGPDLTAVSSRLRGHRALTSWLGSPPTPVMRAVYRTHPLAATEAHALAAFFEDAQRMPAPSPARQRTTLVASALEGAAIGFLIVGVVWRRRFRAVRRPMVAAARTRTSGGRDQ